MDIQITPPYSVSIDEQPVEVVERKGIGHPDTLADLIAETFSNNYSKYCLELLGGVPNHWVDKVLLSGAKSDISFGKASVVKPITAYLFGKVTPSIGDVRVNIEEAFYHSITHVFKAVFGENHAILNYLRFVVDINDGIGTDHPSTFYAPLSPNHLPTFGDELYSNDTVVCTAYADYSETEKLVIQTENFINSCEFKSTFPETGYDVKVLGIRRNQDLSLTICIPFIAEKTPNLQFYKERLEEIRRMLNYRVQEWCPIFRLSLYLNTKDSGKYVYLTNFGTALDKGDYGAVGRGNRYNGVIPANREISMEAVSGKNPLHHAGKLYNVIAYEIAHQIALKFGTEAVVNISTFNGSSIYNPEFVFIKSAKDLSSSRRELEGLIYQALSNISVVSRKIIYGDPVAAHVQRSTYLA